MTSTPKSAGVSTHLGRYSTPGTAPGTLDLAPDAPRPGVEVIAYGSDVVQRQRLESVDDLKAWLGRHPVTWIDVDGHGSGEDLEQLGEIFGLHSLSLEDVVNAGQRAKVEAWEDHLFIVARMPTRDGEDTEQLAMFLGDGWLMTIQERPGDCFGAVRDRLQREGTRIRSSGADYLAYALLDALIDSYFPILEDLGNRLEDLEEEVLEEQGEDTIAEIHRIRRRLLSLRKTVAPHRELVNSLLRDESPLVSGQTRTFLRDVYDHVLRIRDLAESYRELSSDIMATHMSAVSNHMNEVMKMLTIVATIFMPLSFIAGLYGMNFDPEFPWNMPELGWRYGYPFALGLMAGVAGAFIWWIWRKGWFD